jgi:hypothetical protein
MYGREILYCLKIHGSDKALLKQLVKGRKINYACLHNDNLQYENNLGLES